jgi:HEPN domain-containing protein
MICEADGVPKQTRTRAVSPAQVRAYARKAEEFLAAATTELEMRRTIAATSLAIHAGINAADALTGMRLGRRAAGQDHDEVLSLLRDAGPDGAAMAKELIRLLPVKTKSEYEPDDVPKSEANTAVERARRCVAVARRVLAAQTR